jgi:hypothetical protein
MEKDFSCGFCSNVPCFVFQLILDFVIFALVLECYLSPLCHLLFGAPISRRN